MAFWILCGMCLCVCTCVCVFAIGKEREANVGKKQIQEEQKQPEQKRNLCYGLLTEKMIIIEETNSFLKDLWGVFFRL